jgi:hypothetical protein
MSNDLFARGSWPWTICRQSLLVAAGATEALDPEANRILHSDRTGPIGCLVASELLEQFGSRGPAAAFARRGMERLDADHFAQDCSALLSGDWPLPKVLLRAGENLRDMTVSDIGDMTAVMPPRQAMMFAALAADLRLHKNQRIETSLSEALAHAWSLGLKEQTSSELQRLAALTGNLKQPLCSGRTGGRLAPRRRRGRRDRRYHPAGQALFIR